MTTEAEEPKTTLTPEEMLMAMLIMKEDLNYLSNAVGMLSRVLNEYCLQYPLHVPGQGAQHGAAPIKSETHHGFGTYL